MDSKRDSRSSLASRSWRSLEGPRASRDTRHGGHAQAHREIKGVFGINDNCAERGSVIEAAGRKDIAVVGFDATDEAQAIARADRSKPTSFSAEEDRPAHHRRRRRLLRGKTVPPVTAVDVGIVDAKTLASSDRSSVSRNAEAEADVPNVKAEHWRFALTSLTH